MYVLCSLVVCFATFCVSESFKVAVSRSDFCRTLCGVLWKRFGGTGICTMDNTTGFCVVNTDRSILHRVHTHLLLQKANPKNHLLMTSPIYEHKRLLCMDVLPMFGMECLNNECGYEKAKCRNGRCDCDVGYSYDFKEGRCVKKCSKYGREFAVYKNSGINGHNKVSTKTKNAAECLKLCLNTRSFVCINAEFGNPKCHLCDEAWHEIESRATNYGTDKGWTLFHRHCEQGT